MTGWGLSLVTNPPLCSLGQMGESSSDRDVVVITGASTGIGRAAALHLAGKGLRVFAGVRTASDGEAVAAALSSEAKAAGGNVEPLIIDVADGESIARATAEVGERLGGSPLRGLVNNAGIGVGGPQEYLTLEDWRRQFEVNVFGLVDTTQKLLPHLVRSRGRVVNVSSASGRVATPLEGPYSASKFAVEGLTASLRMELRPFGVWAACVEPGAVKTEAWKKANEQLARYRVEIPAVALERYRERGARFERFLASGERRAVEAIRVARAIEHALLAARPRMRYPVGPDIRAVLVLQWLLPDRAFEWVLRKAL
jgi:NAD(P)-dependent dehydrogenase (short-subunit alcohol dehydrogenase family)